MLCEKCQQQPATVHLQQIINGEKKETYLCQNCATLTDASISFDNLFQGFLDSFFAMPNLVKTGTKEFDKPAISCNVCGLNYSEFKKTGKFGCADCYQVFKKEIDSILKNIQGSNLHEGKFPQKSGLILLEKREIENLKALLRKAIEDEEYETAANLRDKIKEIENKHKDGGELYE